MPIPSQRVQDRKATPYFLTAPVNSAALPGGAEHDGADRGDQAGMGIRDDQAHPGQAAGTQGAQELGPERLVLAVAYGQAEHFAVAVGGDGGGDDNGLGDDLVMDRS